MPAPFHPYRGAVDHGLRGGKGGQGAIARAEQYLRAERTGGKDDPPRPEQIRDQLHLAVDRVMGEGSLFAPDLAGLAFKQAAGDTLKAAISFVQAECREDMGRFCKAVTPGEGRLIKCLEENEAGVSERCKAALKDVGLKE